MNLQHLKDKIESYPKNYQIEIGRIFLENKINVNENQNGMFINLSNIPIDILKKIDNFIAYIEIQESAINTVETTKDGLKDIYFNTTNDG